MYEMDLVPNDYRERLKIRRWCQRFAIYFAGLLLVLFGSNMFLKNSLKQLQEQIGTLQQGKSFNLSQRGRLDALNSQHQNLTKKLEILSSLRGGAPVEGIFRAIDRVMDGDVWFRQWSFQRAGELSIVKPETVQTGYFIVVPKTDIAGKDQAWRLTTHMEISGQAGDHAALARFLRRLIDQPEIEDVQVVKTNRRGYTRIDVIDFELVVIVDDKQGKGRGRIPA